MICVGARLTQTVKHAFLFFFGRINLLLNIRRLHVRKNAGQMEHFGDQEREVGYDNDDHRLHDTHVMRESSREASGKTHQGSDTDRSDDDDEERDHAEYDIDSDDVLLADLT